MFLQELVEECPQEATPNYCWKRDRILCWFRREYLGNLTSHRTVLWLATPPPPYLPEAGSPLKWDNPFSAASQKLHGQSSHTHSFGDVAQSRSGSDGCACVRGWERLELCRCRKGHRDKCVKTRWHLGAKKPSEIEEGRRNSFILALNRGGWEKWESISFFPHWGDNRSWVALETKCSMTLIAKYCKDWNRVHREMIRKKCVNCIHCQCSSCFRAELCETESKDRKAKSHIITSKS